MSKIAQIADVHLGATNKHAHAMWGLKTTRNYLAEAGIDTCFILGDLFHDRESLSLDVLCDAYNFFLECKQKYNQNWLAFPGNHDMFLKHSWDITSIRPLGSVLNVIETIKIADIDGRRFWILPFIYTESAYLAALEQIHDRYEQGDVLLTHVGTTGAVKNVCFLLTHWNVISFAASPFDHVFAGHFHLHQQVGRNLWYPGSLVPLKFDEGDSPHGLIVFDTETSGQEFVDLWEIADKCAPDGPRAPRYHNVTEEFTERDFTGDNVRVFLTRELSPNEKHELRQKLVANGAQYISFNDPVEEERDLQLQTAVTTDKLSISDLFSAYWDQDTKAKEQLHQNILFRLHAEILKEGDELWSQREDADTIL